MIKLVKKIALITFLLSYSVSAISDEQQPDKAEFTKIQLDASECVAFYRYGHALTKRNIHSYRISDKFNALNKFVRKQLKLDVGEDKIQQIRMAGKANFKAYMETNDHKYEIKVDDYDTELLDLYKRYNDQCQAVIQHYKAK